MQPEQLDFSAGEAQAGFRLHRLVVHNWGAFDRLPATRFKILID
jgi:uncharacterized protein YPO0396